MKLIKTTFMLMILVVTLVSCNNNDEPTPEEQDLFERISGEWRLGQNSSVILDDVDITLNYPGLRISFDRSTYNTFEAGDLFNATGTWNVLDQEAQIIRLDRSRTIFIVTLTEDVFNFTYSLDGTSGAVFGAAGNYNITLER